MSRADIQERVRLLDEIDRLTRELDEARTSSPRQLLLDEVALARDAIDRLTRERDEARAVIARLPTDASGRHVIAHEDELYHPKFPGGCGYYDGEQAAFYCGCGDYDYYPISECWPTAEAAEKARKPCNS
jgi:hypothetical protein